MIHLTIDIPTKHIQKHEKPQSCCIIDSYELGDILGTGANGEVRLVTHIITHQQYAAKIIFYNDEHQIKQAQNEIHLYTHLNHTHFTECIHINQHATYVKEDGSKHDVIFIVMELATGGDLFSYIQQHQRLSESKAQYFFNQLIKAVSYLHQHGYAHRDLKPENLLLNSSHTHLSLVDFGCTTSIYDVHNIQCGTAGYMAPETWNKQYTYDATKVDIWACGVILFSMIAGASPYTPPSFDDIHQHQPHHDWWLHKLETHQYDLFWSAHARNGMIFSYELRDLIQGMLQFNPDKRMNMDDIIKHPWITSQQQQSQQECDVSYHTKQFTSHLTLPSNMHIQRTRSYSSHDDVNSPFYSSEDDGSYMHDADFLSR